MDYLLCYLQQISPVILCLVQADPALPERPAVLVGLQVLVDPYCLDLFGPTNPWDPGGPGGPCGPCGPCDPEFEICILSGVAAIPSPCIWGLFIAQWIPLSQSLVFACDCALVAYLVYAVFITPPDIDGAPDSNTISKCTSSYGLGDFFIPDKS